MLYKYTVLSHSSNGKPTSNTGRLRHCQYFTLALETNTKSNGLCCDIFGKSADSYTCNIYTFQRDTHCCSTDCLLMLRCQLYLFQTVTVHPQELLFRCCMCRLWYVPIRPAGTSRTYQIVRFLRHTIVCTYSI